MLLGSAVWPLLVLLEAPQASGRAIAAVWGVFSTQINPSTAKWVRVSASGSRHLAQVQVVPWQPPDHKCGQWVPLRAVSGILVLFSAAFAENQSVETAN